MKLNKTEALALNLLKREGYKESEIYRKSNKSPDFICVGNKRFEVKSLVGKQIIFYSIQTKKLKDTDVILVYKEKNFIMRFLWKDRKKIPYKIKIENNDNSILLKNTNGNIWRKFTGICKAKGESVGDELTKILVIYLKKYNLDEQQQTKEKPKKKQGDTDADNRDKRHTKKHQQ